MRDLTLGVDCLAAGRAAPAVEDSPLLTVCRCPGGVGDGRGNEEGGRDGDPGTDGGRLEFPEGGTVTCELGALSTESR